MKRQATEVGRPGSGVSTPITSVVPSSVHKAVVNGWGKSQLIPFGRVSSYTQLGRCLKLRKEANGQEAASSEAGKSTSRANCAKAEEKAATEREVFSRSADAGAERRRYRCRCTRNVRGGATWTRRESGTRVHDLY